MWHRHPHTLHRLLVTALSLGIAAHCSESIAAWWAPWQKSDKVKKNTLPGADVLIRFIGAQAFPEKKLRGAIEEQLTQIRNEGLSRPNADDAAYYLSAFYQDNGYASVEVTWEIRGKQLILNIQEGIPAYLRSLLVTGNSALSTDLILAVLKSPTVDRFENPDSRLPFVRDDFMRGSSRLIDWYQAEGFLNADVASPEVTYSADSKQVDVTIHITEGKRFYFGDIKIQGHTVYETAALLKAIAPLTKLPYTAPRVSVIQSTLAQFYTSHAHFDSTVDVTADLNRITHDGLVPLLISVHAGPTYKFQGVEVTGLLRIKPAWVRSRLQSLDGQPYTSAGLEAKSRRLMASGLFSSLRITPVPQSDRTLRLQVTAEEAKARELGFSGGYGSYEGVMFGLRTSDRNLFGQGLQGGIELGVSQRTISTEATFANPWLFETQTEFISRVFLRSRLELGYDKREAGIRGELSRKLTPNLQIATFGQTRTVEITTSEITQNDLGKTAYQVGTAGLSATLDRRDNALHPTRGWVAAGIIDTNVLQTGDSFVRTSGRLGWHYPLPAGIGFAASARLGIISQQNTPPIDERYFLGGATTVRSFRERKLGQQDTRQFPIGGAAYTLANAETDFPLWQNLRGALFFDAGSLSSAGAQIPTSNFRTAVGIGLRYALPVGPLRFDVGLNPDRKPSESWGAAHLSFGFAF
jgi:outer membrane protein assembly complex protein YaeT